MDIILKNIEYFLFCVTIVVKYSMLGDENEIGKNHGYILGDASHFYSPPNGARLCSRTLLLEKWSERSHVQMGKQSLDPRHSD